MASTILGIGHALPSRVVTNEELAARLGTDAASVEARTAISQRCYAEAGTGPSDLALDAAKIALERAKLSTADLQLIVFATQTPDVAFPGAGCYLQHKLEAGTIGALDIRAQCLGFVFGLATADRFIQAGTYERILLAAGEVHSTSLDFSPDGVQVTPFLGDGAAAVVLGPGTGDRGLLATVMHSDGAEYERFWCEYPAGRQHPVRMTVENFRDRLHLPKLDSGGLDSIARRLFPEVVEEALGKANLSRADVGHFFLHYVNPRVALEVGANMGVPAERLTASATRNGHIAAASLPIALSQAWNAGGVGEGDLVCLAGVGSGVNWGAAVLRL